MAYKSGTYVAFDGLGETDPTKSDYKYFSTLKMWNENNNIDFNITDSHEKTDSVQDTSKKSTLESRIQERLRNSKNMIVVLSKDTRKIGSMLSYEIEQAVDNYELPLIVAYADVKLVKDVDSFSSYWLNALSQRIKNNSAKAIHIPFKKEPIFAAIGQFYVKGKVPKGGAKGYYNDDAYRSWGLL